MAFNQRLGQRLFNISKLSTQSLTNCRISSPAIHTRLPQNPKGNSIAPDPGDAGIFRRFIHKRTMFKPDIPSELRSIPFDTLMGKLGELDISKDRIRFDGLALALAPSIKTDANISPEMTTLTVQDARKLLQVAHLELVKSRLREIGDDWISYSEYVRTCQEGCSDPEQGLQLAKKLDESGNVIVFANSVCIRPEQITKAIGGLIPLPGPNANDPRRKEMEELEKQKAFIDKKAETLVRRELWCGLGYLFVQTLGFMRLTFWELTWDVMEPICFYVTSIYFMAGYTFFLRTSIEPSFEGFYQSRFISKQKRLMKVQNFDLDRYNELKKVFYPKLSSGSVEFRDKALTCALGH